MSDFSLSVSIPSSCPVSRYNFFGSEQCSKRHRRVLLLVASVISFCLAVVLMLVSLLIMSNGREYTRLLPLSNVYFVTVAFTISFGVITFLTSCFGCYSAISEKLVALVVLTVLCGLIASIELSGGIIVIDRVVKGVSLVRMNVLNDSFRNRTGGHVEELWNHMEVEMDCCGVCGPEDYAELQYNLSLSCCSSHKHGEMNCSLTKAHEKGCFTGLNEYFRGALKSMSIIVICASLLQVFVVGIAFSIAWTVWNKCQRYAMKELANVESVEDKVNRFLNSSKNPEVDETTSWSSSAHSSCGGLDPACFSVAEGGGIIRTVHVADDELQKSCRCIFVNLRELSDFKVTNGLKRVEPGDLEVNEEVTPRSQRKHIEEKTEENREHPALKKEDIA